jgi:hypothetical protein
MPKPKGDAFAALVKKPAVVEAPAPETPVEAATAVQEPPTPQRAKKPANAPQRKPKPSTRQGTQFIGGHFPPEVNIQLKTLGLKTGQRTTQELVAEAFDLLFQSHGMPTIARRPNENT